MRPLNHSESRYFGLGKLAEAKTFLLAYPDGTLDQLGMRYWNATDACCAEAAAGDPPDDVAYVNAIIDDVEKNYNVDGRRIYVAGHSNGGFMTHRMACDAANRIAAVVSLAGAQWKDDSHCKPVAPVAVLQVHGDQDQTIHYEGGHLLDSSSLPEYPSAHDTVATWARKNGCKGALTATGMTLDLVSDIPGAETKVERYDGCPAGGTVELWTLQGGMHVPQLQPIWADTIYGFLSAHPKP